MSRTEHRNELLVLSLIAFGLLLVLILIISGLFGWFESRAQQALPNWAENVLVSIASVAGLKLGDTLNALVTLATGRQVETFGQQLATSTPAKRGPVPETAAEAAEETAEAAQDKADEIRDTARP